MGVQNLGYIEEIIFGLIFPHIDQKKVINTFPLRIGEGIHIKIEGK